MTQIFTDLLFVDICDLINLIFADLFFLVKT